MCRDASMLLNHHAANTESRQFQGRAEPNGSSADDDNQLGG